MTSCFGIRMPHQKALAPTRYHGHLTIPSRSSGPSKESTLPVIRSWDFWTDPIQEYQLPGSEHQGRRETASLAARQTVASVCGCLARS